MLIVTTEKTDIYRNLALEEWLLENAPQVPVLFLYVNDPCVVIGKNQNPWRECRLSLMDEEGVVLARRISGGGAVYHDAGNLNVSIIVPRTEYVEQKQYDLIFQALESFLSCNSVASKVRKNSLVVDGKKFSGQAFCHRRDRTLHHGTLLVNTDLARLGRYLGSELNGIETKAIASVPAEVANLSQFAPELTIEALSAALIETFAEMYAPAEGSGPTAVVGRVTSPGVTYWGDGEIPGEELLPNLGICRRQTKAWKFSHTPRFQVTINGQALDIEKGRITNMEGLPLFEEWLASD